MLPPTKTHLGLKGELWFGPEKMTGTHPQTLALKSSLVGTGPAPGAVLMVV